ncbi:hypothetical protein C0J29_13780 [Mycobacterium paragordonae]|uniref:hypothetical protein n=1 Tax=Mycobacterium paragordonae TaxID=1389713 RepID=UPI000EAAAF93|nr:hypothetical protein [Mycobacterium paragordonae]AYE95715.1 hypothetical protein C0J29_13780 [Mycobacterium paragordonae]
MSDNGIGVQIPDPYRGWLVFDHLPDELQRAEDATLAHDNQDERNAARCYSRPATETERTLLAHLGWNLPDDLTTHVDRITPSVRRRRWPQLETQLAAEESTP